MRTLIRRLTATPTPIIRIISGSIHRPITHTIRLIPLPPIAPLTHIPYRLDHLLLRPHGMTSAIVPPACCG